MTQIDYSDININRTVRRVNKSRIISLKIGGYRIKLQGIGHEEDGYKWMIGFDTPDRFKWSICNDSGDKILTFTSIGEAVQQAMKSIVQYEQELAEDKPKEPTHETSK